jgi:hypothetical protein
MLISFNYKFKEPCPWKMCSYIRPVFKKKTMEQIRMEKNILNNPNVTIEKKILEKRIRDLIFLFSQRII